MAETIRFRTALGGFNRQDVANYIETSSKKHREELSQLKDELTCAQAEKKAALEQVKTLTAQLEALQEGKEPVSAPAIEDPEALELAAYRRAEAAERTANQRIRRQIDRLMEVMNDASSEHAGSSEELKAVMQSVMAGVEEMQELFTRVNGSFQKTETAMAELKKELAE